MFCKVHCKTYKKKVSTKSWKHQTCFITWSTVEYNQAMKVLEEEMLTAHNLWPKSKQMTQPCITGAPSNLHSIWREEQNDGWNSLIRVSQWKSRALRSWLKSSTNSTQVNYMAILFSLLKGFKVKLL